MPARLSFKKRRTMRGRIHLLAAITLVFIANGAAFPFGGEDPLAPGDPWKPADRARWYHQRITWDAAVSAGFSQGAASTLAWHGDYIDSYLYNPLWWIDVTRNGGVGRISASVASYNELAKLHFDDSFSRGAVKAAWRKYTLGTMNGLIWALDRYNRGDMTSVSAAQNILGVSMHAIEDFYSHSNWVDDPARRTKTWFEMTDAQKSKMTLYTGFYEEQGQLGVHGHGKI